VSERFAQVGLSHEEYLRIIDLLGREPNDLELGLFGGMWSEHCSYKSSRLLLGRFPTTGSRIAQGPGENAGVVDIGDGLGVVFKAESHNHPSAVEPFQGAATGVGGIIRDIFTMGARPIALFDSLRFGELSDARSRYLLGGVIAGISFYGNCIGIPTVGGEIYFDECYAHNPLVNVMCVGTVDTHKIVRARAEGVGNSVLLVGAKTGRDGIHGASLLASQAFSEKPEQKRPAVQVGDPFMEKLLVEACLEVLETGHVVGLQDLGASGLTSACSEVAARAGTGLEIDVAAVPRRESDMSAYEVMLSESQERMLVIVRRGLEREVSKVFSKWGLDSAHIGRVTDDGMLRILDNSQVVAEVRAKHLADEAPAYSRDAVKPAYLDEVNELDLDSVPLPEDYGVVLQQLVRSPNIASKEWVYRQYDHMVQLNSVVLPGADAAVLRIKGGTKAIALCTDANGRYAYLDPYSGGAIAVAEAARNVAACGAQPVAITNCLNFGNPERPETMWQFAQCIDGMSDACRMLDTPVTGGNVSFYNETLGSPIYPTPVVGMLGVIDDVSCVLTPGFKSKGDSIILLGRTLEELGGSEYLKSVHARVCGKPPVIELELEKACQQACLDASRERLLHSAHDCSDGGLMVCIAECCFGARAGAQGADLVLSDKIRPDALLFGESQSRIVVSCGTEDAHRVIEIAESRGVPACVIGRVDDGTICVSHLGSRLVDVSVPELRQMWKEAIPCTLK